jgi:signal peptidase II
MINFAEFKNIKNLLLKKKNIKFILIILLIFFLDRISKINILNKISDQPNFINDFINIDLVWNTGIGFGLLSAESTLIYNLVTVIIGLVILGIFYVLLISNNFDKLIYSIIMGGAIGNFYDRMIYNAVPDFIDLHYNDFHWFVFNVADIFISLGILVLLLSGFLKKN